MGYYDEGYGGSTAQTAGSYFGTTPKKKKSSGWSLPNLGGISFLKEIGEGITGLGEIPYNVVRAGADIVHGDVHGAASAMTDAGRGVGDFGAMSVLAADNLVSTLPGGQFIAGQTTQRLANYLGTGSGDGNRNLFVSPQMAEALKHHRSKGFIQNVQEGGILRAAGHTALSAAFFAGPWYKGLAAEGAAAGAQSAIAEAAGNAELAGRLAESSAKYSNAAENIKPFAHPVKTFVSKPIAETVRAMSEKGYPTEVPEAAAKPETTGDVLGRMSQDREAAPAEPKPGPFHETPEAADFMRRSEELADESNRRARGFSADERTPEQISQAEDELRAEYDQAEAAHNAKAQEPRFAVDTEGRTADILRNDAEHQAKLQEMAAAEDPAVQAAQNTTDGTEKINVPQDPRSVRPKAGAEEAKGFIKTAVDIARGTERRSSVAEDLKTRLAEPPPVYAQWLADKFPPSVNRVIGRFAEPIERSRLHHMARDRARFVEVAQREVRNHPSQRIMRGIADVLRQKDGSFTDRELETMVGEAVSARVDGRAFLHQLITSDGDPELTQAVHDQIDGNYGNIPDPLLEKFTPAERNSLDALIDNAAHEQVQLQRAAFNTLLSSTKGAQGLERAVLEDDSPLMSKDQVRRFNQIRRDQRARQAAIERIPEADRLRAAEAKRKQSIGVEKMAETKDLEDKIGVEERTAQALHDPPPDTLLDRNIESTVDSAMETVGDNRIFDVAKGVAEDVTEGYVVGISPQWTPVALEDFIVAGRDLVRDAMRNPKNPSGGTYEYGVWNGHDARLRIRTVTNPETGIAEVHGDIVLSGQGGKPMPRWQAEWIGTAHRQTSIQGAAGNEIKLPQSAASQDIAAIYLDEAMDPHSSFSRFARKLDEVNDTKTTSRGLRRNLVRGGPDNVNKALRLFSTWDYSLSRSNPEWKIGDYFKLADISAGHNQPIAEALLGQTGLNLTTENAVQRAMDVMDFNKINKAMRWYYDSHQYIEDTWRYNKDGSVKMVRLLNGTERPAADVLYDLIAVTSVMADPQTNLGRALSGFANLDDFLKARKGSFKKAEAMLKKLDKMPNTRSKIVRDEEGNITSRVAAPAPKGTKGTLLSDKFIDNEDVQQLTEDTSMTDAPKYNVMDVLRGKLRLDEATNADIAGIAEDWGGSRKTIRNQDFKPVTAKRFVKFVQGAEDNPRGGVKTSEMLTPRTEQEWIDGGFKMFMSKDGKVGYALDPNGDLTGVINNGGEKGAGGSAVEHAVAMGAKTLDAFEMPSEGMPEGLPGFYKRHGFVEDWRGQWDDELAGRSSMSNGERPDVVGMKLDVNARRAQESALMEHEGTNLLGKLRSFRSNLSNPHESLAVTLDTVMARMWGFKSQDWSKPGMMAAKAAEIREQADVWSHKLGRKVMPHELQALLWVFTKQEVGQQDFGRLLAHGDRAHEIIDIGRAPFDERATIDPHTWDPFAGFWEEQKSYGEEGQRIIAEGGNLPGPREVPIETMREGTDKITKETRVEFPDDASKLEKIKEYQAKYEERTLPRIRKAMIEGNYYKAHSLVDEWIAARRRSILGDTEAGAFGEHMTAKPTSAAAKAMERLRNAKYVPGPEDVRGSTGMVAQQFNGHLRGALFDAPTKDGRLMMRMFKDAALDTLAHEGGHLLRRILPGDMVAELEQHFPGLQDRYGTASNTAAEESFISSLMQFMRQHGEAPEGGLNDVYSKIAATLEEQWAAMSDDTSALHPDVVEYWDGLFNPEIVRPDTIVDPISTQRVEGPALNTKKFRWETEAKFAERTRQYGESRGRLQEMQRQVVRKRRIANLADSAARRMYGAIITKPNIAQLEAEKIGGNIDKALEKLGAELEDPKTKQVPKEFQQVWSTIQQLHEDAKADKSGRLAELFDDVPKTFSEVLRLASERGFEFSHMPDITWEQATKNLFGHVRLGKLDTEELSGRRKENRGILSKADLQSRSMRALGSAFIDATNELHKNALVRDIEEIYARDWTNEQIPEGWKPWDADRDFILTGTRTAEGGMVAPNTTKIIPDAVAKAIKSLSSPMEHQAFHFLTRNPIFSVWRNLILTLSAKWYVNNFIGNVIVSALEGARPQDFATAWRQWKSGNTPADVAAESFAHSSFQGAETMLNPRTVREAVSTGRAAKDAGDWSGARDAARGAKDTVKHRLVRLNSAVDEMSRSAVYNATLRKFPGNTELAMTRAYEANVDYGDLSPLERGVVRNIFPFYAWQKGITKILMRMPVDNPRAAALLMMVGQAHRERLKDMLEGDIPDSYLGLTTFGEPTNLRALNPLQDPLISLPSIRNSLHPFADIAIRSAYQDPKPGTGMPGMNEFGGKAEDVNIRAALQQNFQSAPSIRLGQSQTLGEDVYGKQPSLEEALASFLGTPQEQDVGAINDRLNPKKKPRKKKLVGYFG